MIWGKIYQPKKQKQKRIKVVINEICKLFIINDKNKT